MIEQCAELFRAKAEEKGLQLDVAVADDIQRRLRRRQGRGSSRSSANLLSNAVKFTAAGSVP